MVRSIGVRLDLFASGQMRASQIDEERAGGFRREAGNTVSEQ